MKAFSAVLIVALVAQASASPCTDICNGSCDMVQQTVGLLFPQIATIVAPNIEICRQSCTAVCTCTDGCTAQCNPAYEACISAAKAAYNPFSMVVCQAQYAVCAGPCNMQCSSTIVSGLVQQVQGFAATISQTVSVAVGQLMGPTSAP
ncbi:hypothetical protein EGW08_003497 [Elysia chlorotica]|uniref:VWF/SSPO/Zonadhesin-like cysteine-rich domain-containing protein n=1 Tax=Elysia chlorotica TaxID=188477 RepID=A0A433U4R8_ELYCH|nr:hypothetical protein EGW08_003497 [Elysia chlorotica]